MPAQTVLPDSTLLVTAATGMTFGQKAAEDTMMMTLPLAAIAALVEEEPNISIPTETVVTGTRKVLNSVVIMTTMISLPTPCAQLA